MKIAAMSIRADEARVEILDQTALPHKEQWVDVTEVDQMDEAIRSLRVRGAPLIGVAAALCLGRYALRCQNSEKFRQSALKLRESRPTAVNLMIAIDRLLSLAGNTESFDAMAIYAEADQIYQEDTELCLRIGQYGAELIEDGDSIITHCNTGGLATAGIGTALGVLQTAHQQGKSIHVYVDETRPLLQGGRLTAYELDQLQIPYTLICDNMAAMLMAQGKITKAIVGADRIAMNGDFANKIGTYSLAIACRYHNVPFYVAAPVTTMDTSCMTGAEIPIEQRSALEVHGVQLAGETMLWAPKSAQVYNPAFDVTPAELTSQWILDKGRFDRQQIQAGVLSHI